MLFEIELLRKDEEGKLGKPFPKFISSDRTFAIIEDGASFAVKLVAKNEFKVYASKLFFNGVQVGGRKKTFKGKGHYVGYKTSLNETKEFCFTEMVADPEKTQSLDNNNSDLLESQFPSIYVEVYKTRWKLCSGQPKLQELKVPDNPDEDPLIDLKNKKKGGEVKILPGKITKRKISKTIKKKILESSFKIKDRNSYYQREPCEDVISTLKIYYGTRKSLIAHGILSTKIENHFKYFATEDLNPYLLGQMLREIIGKHSGSDTTIDESFLIKELKILLGKEMVSKIRAKFSFASLSITQKSFDFDPSDQTFSIMKETPKIQVKKRNSSRSALQKESLSFHSDIPDKKWGNMDDPVLIEDDKDEEYGIAKNPIIIDDSESEDDGAFKKDYGTSSLNKDFEQMEIDDQNNILNESSINNDLSDNQSPYL